MSTIALTKADVTEVVALRLPQSLADRLQKVASLQGMTRPEYIRRIIMDATGFEMAGRKIPHCEVVQHQIPERVPEPVETVDSLWERGFTANQIAARLRIPYRSVLNEIYGEGQIR